MSSGWHIALSCVALLNDKTKENINSSFAILSQNSRTLMFLLRNMQSPCWCCSSYIISLNQQCLIQRCSLIGTSSHCTGGAAVCVLWSQKARCPAVQSVFCLCDILDCSLSQSTAMYFITITSPLLLLLLHFLPGYCTAGL